MCLYCNMGDFEFRHNPPWRRDSYPQFPPSVPLPAMPMMPNYEWGLDKLKEYYDLLKRVKEMEDKLGCPCEPNKADYLKLFEDRIASLEKKLGDKPA